MGPEVIPKGRFTDEAAEDVLINEVWRDLARRANATTVHHPPSVPLQRCLVLKL